MTVTIWHNPRCSKSRTTLSLLEEQGITPTVRLYLQDSPTADDIKDALRALQLPPGKLVRRGEKEYKAAGLGPGSSDVELIEAMARFPKLIERPIVFANGSARVGRPPEAVLDIL